MKPHILLWTTLVWATGSFDSRGASKPSSSSQKTATKPTSEFSYTSPAKSKRVQFGEGRASYLCSGFGGYQVEYEIFASRSGINLRHEGKTVSLLEQTFEACPGENPEKANDVVQWRGFRKGSLFIPYALIYRLYSANPDSPKTRHNTLVVIKLDGANSRVVGQVSGSRSDGNTAAEALADRLCAPGSDTALDVVGDATPPSAKVSGGAAAGANTGRFEVVRGEDGTTVHFPNGQKFRLESTRGVLGPSANPSSQDPFIGPGNWLVAVNEAPATKTSFVHFYVRDKTGRYSEIKDAQRKVLKQVHMPELPKKPDFIRVEEITDAWDGKMMILLQVKNAKTEELEESAVVIGKTGIIESRFRGE